MHCVWPTKQLERRSHGCLKRDALTIQALSQMILHSMLFRPRDKQAIYGFGITEVVRIKCEAWRIESSPASHAGRLEKIQALPVMFSEPKSGKEISCRQWHSLTTTGSWLIKKCVSPKIERCILRVWFFLAASVWKHVPYSLKRILLILPSGSSHQSIEASTTLNALHLIGACPCVRHWSTYYKRCAFLKFFPPQKEYFLRSLVWFDFSGDLNLPIRCAFNFGARDHHLNNFSGPPRELHIWET